VGPFARYPDPAARRPSPPDGRPSPPAHVCARVGVSAHAVCLSPPDRAARRRPTAPHVNVRRAHRSMSSCPRAGFAGAWRAPARTGRRPSTRAVLRRTLAGASTRSSTTARGD